MLRKFFLTVLTVAGVCGLMNAADLTTESGKVYKNVELRKIAVGCVQIVHDQGNATIELYDLPDNFIAALSIRQRYSLQSLADIKLANGKTYYKTSINSLGGGFISITHLDGMEKIAFKDLPAKYAATFTRKQLEAVSKVHEPKSKDKNKDKNDKKSADDKNAAVERTADGREIHIGSRGGKYYINDAGKKVYISSRRAAGKNSAAGSRENHN